MPSLMGFFDPDHAGNVFAVGSDRLNSQDALHRREGFVESLSVADPSCLQADPLCLLKEEEGFISTGLGGRDNKIRYCVIVGTKESRTLPRSERETLEEGFKGSSDKYESEIEEINFGTNYAMMGILVPMHVAVGEVIEEGIRRCNRKVEILFVDYYVTNVKKPTKGEISRYLRDIRREGK